jgi:MoaA/NifB/PqqE/SkfB family radical SAM enzyme
MFDRNPFFCNYWVTYRCNSRCEFCNIWRDDSLNDVPDADVDCAKKNLEDLKKIGVKMIDFTGGEPLLHKDLPQILAHAKKLGFFVKLSTNGILYPQRAEELRGLVSRLYVSLDTTSREQYERIRGIDGFDSVLKSIQTAKKFNQNICILYTVTDETIQNIASLVDFCTDHKIIVYMHPCFSYFGNKKLSTEHVATMKRYFWQPYVRMSLPDLDFYAQGGNDIKDPECIAGKSTLDISPDNCLTAPCFHRHIQKVKIENNLMSLFHSSQWKTLFGKAGTYEFCDHCTIDCYFGMSYWDKIGSHFFKQNVTFLKYWVEEHRPR